MRRNNERWVVDGKVLKVYEEPECPVCHQLNKVRETASFYQKSLFKEVLNIHWSIVSCERCDCSYVYRSEWSEDES